MTHSLPFYILLVLCLLLATGLTITALHRSNRQRLAWRLLASWLAAAGLWLTAYPPTHQVAGARQEAVLLTDNYSADTLRLLLRHLGSGTRIWRYRPTVATDTPALSSLLALRERFPNLRQLHVLGQGLSTADLPDLGALRLVVHPVAAKAGFRTAQWSREVALGQTVQVEGFLENTPADKRPVWVYLRAAGAPRDSVRLPANQGAFRLHYQPRAVGRNVYELVARRGDQEIAREPVPVEVLPTRPLRVLLVASTPSFEFRFLKNHLASRQHVVAFRAGLSRGISQTEFLNQPAQDLSRLTPSLLARYDVLIADAGSVMALSGAESQTLQNAIRTTGLGFLLLADPTPLPRTSPARSDFAIVARPVSVTAPQPIQWPGSPGKLATLVPAVLRSGPLLRPIVTDAQQNPVVSATRLGAGSVVVSVLPATYSWALQNATAAYEAYWSRLLTAAARPLTPAARWQVQEAWPKPNMPLDLQLVASFPAVQPSVQGPQSEPVRVALRQDTRLPEWSTARYWPTSAGWHRVQVAGQTPSWFYVYDRQNWLLPELRQQQEATTGWTAVGGAAPFSTTTSTREAWPGTWFFLLFLVAAGSLWLEEKL
ncbi:hypothetical protein [Hymenobacter cavernae]|uniref:VWA domain-containing protein n=1 Tax=Hymenobacter cavernae TaxID=2044852 RepID=A0ABQ1TZK8_9BACT|nr:hypothetical protein [Hymenobacter cavernae]GGF05017.1 hypothetical protein GCM10011383_15190 [Hymenobacter cavernae]